MSSMAHAHYAAGILPYTWSEEMRATLFLVGRDVRDGGWSDFGGKVERCDRGEPAATAAREAFEETHGLLMSQEAFKSRIHTSTLLKSRTANNYDYSCYLVEVPFLPYIRPAFAKTLAFLRSRNLGQVFIEKNELMWMTHAMLMRVQKRAVFEFTLNAHRLVLERLAACTSPDEWEEALRGS